MSIKLTAGNRYIETIALGGYYLMKFISKNEKHPQVCCQKASLGGSFLMFCFKSNYPFDDAKLHIIYV